MDRRSFLGSAALAAARPFAVAAQQGTSRQRGSGRGFRAELGLQPLDGGRVGDKPAIKITDIRTFLIGAGGRNWLYVKVLTDQGVEGIGEAYSVGPDEATVKVIEDFKSWLVGQDPRNVQYLFDLMYNTTRFPGGLVVNAAISGIEHALWDVAGKTAGYPCGRCWGAACVIKCGFTRAPAVRARRRPPKTPNGSLSAMAIPP